MEAAKRKAANAIQGAKSAISTAEAAAQKAIDIAAKVKGSSLNNTWNEPLSKAKNLLAEANTKMAEGTTAMGKASGNSVAKVVSLYGEAEALAQQSIDQAGLARMRANDEYKRLKALADKEEAERKLQKQRADRLSQLLAEVKKYQGLLEKAIQNGDPFEIARLMVQLAGAEQNLEKERLEQDMTDKAAVTQAAKRLADMQDLENRLKKAKADMEAAKRQYEDAKSKREGLAQKVEKLKAEIAKLKSQVQDATQKKSAIEEEIKQK